MKKNNIKKNTKGIYFTIDSIIAGGIILVVILLASSFYVKEQPSIHLNYLSQDSIKTLSTITVEEIGNEYLNERIASGDITNLDNSILQQIGEFWADGKMQFASDSVQNVIEPFLPNVVGFGIWIDNELIYKRDMPIKKSLVSSKKIISGITKGQTGGSTRQDPPTLWGPAIVEVRVWE